MSPVERFRNFKIAGPVASAFLRDRVSLVRGIIGPVGGGKTVACIFDSLKNAGEAPVCTDGKIRFRLPIIGLTYGQIERNLLKTWFEWLPHDGGDWTEGEFKGGGGRYGVHKIHFDTIRDGARIEVEFEAIFAAIGQYSVELFMRGFEPTAFWLYEMDLLPRAVLDVGITRLGRYPRQQDIKPGQSFRNYIIGDFNAPDIDNWCFQLFEEEKPEGFKLYKQPSGLSPNAENLKNLPEGYYDRQVLALKSKPRLLKRMVHNQYGPSDDGTPVYDGYSDEIHLAPEALKPLPGLPIRWGFDAGLRRPAGVAAQWLPSGQWRILGEVVPGRMGAKRFAELVQLWMATNAPAQNYADCYADPAAWGGADSEVGELAWVETLQAELGIVIQPAPSNEIALRTDAVAEELAHMIDAHTPAIVLSRACAMLRKGFVSHYRYSVQKVGNSTTTSPKPEKNDWSHPHDALQYLLLGSKGRYAVISGDKHAKPGTGRSGGSRTLANTTRLFG
jgi:hypothetical protein